METECCNEETIRKLAMSEFIFTGISKKVESTLVSTAAEPVMMANIQFENQRFFRGTQNQAQLTYKYVEKCNDIDRLSEGFRYAVAGRFSDGYALIILLKKADGEITQLFMEMPSIPAGWIKVRNSGWQSPFPKQTKVPKWYTDERYKHRVKCSVTGRPALLVNNSIDLIVEPIIAPVVKTSDSTFRDGKFRITVINNSDECVTAEALLSHDGKVSWHDSLIIIDASTKRIWTLSSDVIYDDLQPTELKANETRSAVIDILTLPGDAYWRKGYERVELIFCLGQLCRTGFFYYDVEAHMDKHQNTIGRNAVLECS